MKSFELGFLCFAILAPACASDDEGSDTTGEEHLSASSVWVEGSLARVGRRDAAKTNVDAHLSAGRGEYESFQIVVSGSPAALTNVDVTVSDLTGKSGEVIAAKNVALFREHYVSVTSSSPNWGGSNQPMGPGEYADGLIPFVDPATGAASTGTGALKAAPFDVAQGQNQPVWVDILVPRTATAGAYTGKFTVSSDQGTFEGKIALDVWAFTLPLRPSLKSAFLVWTDLPKAAREELLRNKVSPSNAPASEQRSLIDDLGLTGVNLPFWSGADVGSCRMSPAPSVAQFKSAAAAEQPDLFLYNYSADEIGKCTALYPTIKQWAANMHAAGVSNLVTMAPVSGLMDDGSGTGRSAVDAWTVLPVMYENSKASVDAALKKGDEVWSYNTLVQDAYSPKWEIDFAPINFRIQPGFISQTLGLSGILYWRVDRWAPDAWNQINNAGTYSSANFPGEAVLVYPGKDVGVQGVAPSMRLKWLRDGVEDYEYVALLKKAGKEAWALEQAAAVGPDWTSWTRDTAKLAATRKALGEALDEVGGGPGSSGSDDDGGAGSGGGSGGGGGGGGSVGSGGGGSGGGGSGGGGGSSGTGGPPPGAESVTPASGSGSEQTFRFDYSDDAGAADIRTAGVLFNTSFDGRGACWLVYSRPDGLISMANDDIGAWQSMALGSADTLENGQCSVAADDVSVADSGNVLTVSVKVTFKASFAGTRNVYLGARRTTGPSSSYQVRGTWEVTP